MWTKRQKMTNLLIVVNGAGTFTAPATMSGTSSIPMCLPLFRAAVHFKANRSEIEINRRGMTLLERASPSLYAFGFPGSICTLKLKAWQGCRLAIATCIE
jgi:hypothetical protein